MKKSILIVILGFILSLQSCATNYVVAEPSLYMSSYKLDKKNLGESKKTTLKSFDKEKYVLNEVLKRLDNKKELETLVKKNNLVESLIGEAKTFLGTPYRYGGVSRRGIDCSAFVRSAYKNSLGIQLPRVAASQATKGVKVRKNELKKGDLIFFANRRRISHVGIVERVTENGEIYFIHASSSKGVTITLLNKSRYWQRRFRFGKRILTGKKSEDLLAVMNQKSSKKS